MPTIAALVLTIALLAGCGSDDAASPPPVSQETELDGTEAVIDAWATALTEGDVEAAAELFALPSVAENGPLEVEIETAADALAFNESLPCGAEVVRTETDDEFTIATFRLTERPGGGECGLGADGTAQTAFVIEDGKITEWRRVVVDEGLAPGRAT